MDVLVENVWQITDTHRFPGGIVFPLRCAVVRLADGLWVHSPVVFDDETASAIDALGEVRHLVAPSKMHDLHIEAAAARWPDAQVYGPRALLEGREMNGIPLEEAEWPELVTVEIEGASQANEFVFVHRDSRSLLVTDLLFNFGPAENLQTGAMRWMIGCSGRCAASRSWSWVFADDREALAASARAVLELDFDRLIPAHGDVVDSGAKTVVAEGMSGRLFT